MHSRLISLMRELIRYREKYNNCFISIAPIIVTATCFGLSAAVLKFVRKWKPFQKLTSRILNGFAYENPLTSLAERFNIERDVSVGPYVRVPSFVLPT